MEYTSNYNLAKPEMTDTVAATIPLHSSNMDTIETALTTTTATIKGRKSAGTGPMENLSTSDVKTLLDVDDLENTPQEIYGAFWDKGETPTLTRLNAAKGLTVANGVDTTMALNEFDTSSLFSDWTEVTDALGNVFVRIPKMYIKKVSTTSYMAWYVSRKKFAGAYLPWCFWDFTNSVELDYIDVGKYKASLSGASKLESISGAYPLVLTNIVNFRTYAQANGTGYQQLDIHVMDLLQTLFIIEQGTLYSQSKLAGYTAGNYLAAHIATKTEATANRIVVADAHGALYAVGQAISVGTALGGIQRFYGRTIQSITPLEAPDDAYTEIVFDGAAVDITAGDVLYNTGYKNGFSSGITASVGSINSNSTGKYPFVWHGIESLYGDIYQFVDGVNINNRQAWVCKNTASYASNKFTAPYEQLSYVNHNASGYPTAMGYDAALPFANFPTAVGGATDKYYTDYYYQTAGQIIALVGGHWYNGSSAGLFYWILGLSSATTSDYIGGRLVKKPL